MKVANLKILQKNLTWWFEFYKLKVFKIVFKNLKKILKLLFQLSWKWPFKSFECSNSPFTSKCYPFLNFISLFRFFLLKNLQFFLFLYTFKKNCPWRLQSCKSFKNLQSWRMHSFKTFKNVQPEGWMLEKNFKNLRPEGSDLSPGL